MAAAYLQLLVQARLCVKLGSLSGLDALEQRVALLVRHFCRLCHRGLRAGDLLLRMRQMGLQIW